MTSDPNLHIHCNGVVICIIYTRFNEAKWKKLRAAYSILLIITLSDIHARYDAICFFNISSIISFTLISQFVTIFVRNLEYR